MEFKIGDLVKLKSGGPTMTVEDIGPNFAEETTVYCAWFDGKNMPQKANFPPAALCAA